MQSNFHFTHTHTEMLSEVKTEVNMGVLSPLTDTKIIFKDHGAEASCYTFTDRQTAKRSKKIHMRSPTHNHGSSHETNSPQTVRIKSQQQYSHVLCDQYLFSLYAFISVFNFTGQEGLVYINYL